MLGFTAFSETAISDDGFVRTDPFGGGLVILHFNKAILKFPLVVNKQADFSLNVNKQTDFNLNVNKIINFDVRR